MRYGMQYDPIQGQGHEPFKVGNPAVFKSYLSCLQWELATDHRFLNYGTISKFCQARFLIFSLVFMSRDLEVGTYISCEESTVSPHTVLLFFSSTLSRREQFWEYMAQVFHGPDVLPVSQLVVSKHLWSLWPLFVCDLWLAVSDIVFYHLFRSAKENLMTLYKNDLSRPRLTSENCWKRPNSLHTSMNCVFILLSRWAYL